MSTFLFVLKVTQTLIVFIIKPWYPLFDSVLVYYCKILIKLYQCFENVYCWLIALTYVRKGSDHHKLKQTLEIVFISLLDELILPL